jgi:hypothetical protein
MRVGTVWTCSWLSYVVAESGGNRVGSGDVSAGEPVAGDYLVGWPMPRPDVGGRDC